MQGKKGVSGKIIQPFSVEWSGAQNQFLQTLKTGVILRLSLC